MAGKDWLQGYFSRYPDLSIRAPQGTNLSRAVAFNRPKVQQFFDVYRQLLLEVPCTPSRIWNMDETGITNVQHPSKITAMKGQRIVAKVTSGERGATVTVICAISAAGSFLPPMFIYPRKRMIAALLTGAPPQSMGYTSASGWTDSNLFIKWLEHFLGFTNASKNNPHIIILERERERVYLLEKKHTWHNKTVKILRAGCQKGHSPSCWPPILSKLRIQFR